MHVRKLLLLLTGWALARGATAAGKLPAVWTTSVGLARIFHE